MSCPAFGVAGASELGTAAGTSYSVVLLVCGSFRRTDDYNRFGDWGFVIDPFSAVFFYKMSESRISFSCGFRDAAGPWSGGGGFGIVPVGAMFCDA